MGLDKTKLFVREALGLVKNLSLLDAVSINISDMSAGAALATIGFTTILLPTMAGVNLVYGYGVSGSMQMTYVSCGGGAVCDIRPY